MEALQGFDMFASRGDQVDARGINMEVMTAAADLAAGSDAVILRHPESVKTISKLIKALA